MFLHRLRPQKTLSGYTDLLGTYLRPQWRRTVFMALLLLTSIGLQLFNPQLLRSFIDTALSGGSYRMLLLFGALFLGISLVNQVVSVGATYMSEQVAWTATNWLRRDLVRHALDLDMTFHQAYPPGALIERIDGDTDTLANFFSQTLVHLVGNLLLVVGIVVLFFQIDWRLGAAVVLFLVFGMSLLAGINTSAVPAWIAARQKSADFFGFLGEYLEGTEEVRANGATQHVLSLFFAFLRTWLPISRKASIAGFSTYVASLTIFACGNALALLFGAYFLSIHTITIGTVYLIFAYINLLTDPIEQIRTQLQDLQTAQAGIARIQELRHLQPAIKDCLDGSIPSGALAVDFDHVTFGYQSDEAILHDLTFHLAPGSVLGLLGRTGSGKTTISRLLVRFYEAQVGKIQLGGVPIQAAPLHKLRQRVGMVTQEVQLFRGTIRDNLTFFDRSIPDTQVIAVLHEIGLAQWYESLPQGLDSPIGPGGEGVSAGEAQLLACVRVFLTNPGLVILDEASSRLDLVTERIMEQAMKKLLQGRTAILIMHRLSTIALADDILILQDGRLVEHGSQKVLRANPASQFMQLLTTGFKETNA
jgi:ATP-binding cassette subfamily B protein